MEESLSVELGGRRCRSANRRIVWISDVQRPMTAAEFAKMKGCGTATYFGVISSRPIKNIRTNLPFPSASSRT